MFKPSAKSFLTGNYEVVTKKIIKLIKINKKQSISFLPASLNDFALAKTTLHSLNYASINWFLPDGMPLVWWLKYIHHRPTQRIYGPHLMVSLLKSKTLSLKKHFFICPNNEFEKRIEITIKKDFKHLKKTFVESLDQNGKDDIKNIEQKITQYQPDIIWIGIGSPKQVEISKKIKQLSKKSTIFCVGAAFALLIGKQRKTPKLIQNLGLEWLFRLLTEPLRLWKRYLIIIPKYLIEKTFHMATKKRYKQ